MVLLSVPLRQSQYSPSGPRPRTSPATGYNGKDQRLNSTLATQAEPLASTPQRLCCFGQKKSRAPCLGARLSGLAMPSNPAIQRCERAAFVAGLLALSLRDASIQGEAYQREAIFSRQALYRFQRPQDEREP
jgi:hypothetical protein